VLSRSESNKNHEW
ncbi:hypothetical protein D038_0256B, partial [Vibrio parahaemolyticus IDH02189]